MLTLRSIKSPRDSRTALDEFDPATTTWLVSDLKSKLDLNRRLLHEREFVPGESVLRANELWRLLLTRLRPDLQLVSREFALTLIAHRLTNTDLAWAKAPGAAQTVYDYMTQLMPVLAHPNGEEMMATWFEQHEGSRARWGRWFDLAVKLWADFLDEGYLAPAWASGVLVNETAVGEVWRKPLVVDLGAELNQVEADLLLVIADYVDVVVLRPDPTWKKEYARSLIAYELLEAKLGIAKETEGSVEVGKSVVSYRKYTTMIAEVKDATAQTRKWLDHGDSNGPVKPSEIAIVAPDIEAYWLALSIYFEQEGIPVQKDRVRRLHSYPDVAQWLARLRLKTGAFDESDMELALYGQGSTSEKLIPYDRFKMLFSVMYAREDLSRAKDVAKMFAIELDPGEEATRDEFIAWSLKQLSLESADVWDQIELAYKKIFAECPESLSLPVNRWMAYLEQITSKVECRVQDGDPDGVACIRLSSAENSPAKKMIVLGLTETALRQSVGTAILAADISSLAREFGFQLASEDQAKLEFEARWIIEGGERELILCVPETDFNASAQAASWLWIKGAREAGLKTDAITVPNSTRWDELQKITLSEVAKLRGWKPSRLEILSQALDEDFHVRELEPFAEGLVERLSPSGIEDYLECPFIFASKRLFGLSDAAELDLEIDASRRGSLMHKLFELLTVEPFKSEYSDDELDAVVEQAREKAGIELADLRLWPPLKARHKDLASRFLAFEKDYRKKFPESKTVGREFDIAGYLRPATGELVRAEEPGALKFIGRIDRVDADAQGNVAIYDYKSSEHTAKQFGSWIKNNKIQLLLYSMAVEQGLTELEPKPVMSAIYYVSRPLMRDHGFKVEGLEQGLYDIPDKRKRNRLSSDAKSVLFKEGEDLVQKAVAGIQAGNFQPNPRDANKCNDCKWSALCRMPHLNS